MEKISEILKEALSNLGEEEKEQLRHTILTRADTQAEADVLFGVSPAAREQVANEVDKLFVQAKVARKPNTGVASRDVMSVPAPPQKDDGMLNRAYMDGVSKTASIDAFIDQEVGVYERYPELMKVSGAGYASGSSKLAVKPKATEVTGPTPVKSSLSGGAA